MPEKHEFVNMKNKKKVSASHPWKRPATDGGYKTFKPLVTTILDMNVDHIGVMSDEQIIEEYTEIAKYND